MESASLGGVSVNMETHVKDEIHNCVIKLRENPLKRRDKVYIGCGAGFGGDRILGALKLLQRVEELNYLVLECLAERTLADRYQVMVSGGDGYDSRISEWMHVLLPIAMERGVCIITNMGAMDPCGAQEKVVEIASSLGLNVSVGVAYEVFVSKTGSGSPHEKSHNMEGGISTYLGAAPIVECLEKHQPNVVITSRVADAALFLAPMIYELGWNWDSLELLAQGSLAGHLLECGCQLTGGYFMHPGDKRRDMSLSQLLDLSHPYAEISSDGRVCVAKAEHSGGVLNFSTCAQQLLYEIGDPSSYVTPDVIIDLQNVSFSPLSSCKVLCAGAESSAGLVPEKLLQLIPKDCGWKGWGEISYGGYECVKRAEAAEFLVDMFQDFATAIYVRSWLEEILPGISSSVFSYIIGLDSLKATSIDDETSSSAARNDVRLRMDGLFELKEHAILFTREFTALYTNGPAGGGGISVGHKREVILEKQLVDREHVSWRTSVKRTVEMKSNHSKVSCENHIKTPVFHGSIADVSLSESDISPAPSGQKIPLYDIAHSRAGDKGNDLNFSIIPHFPSDIERLKLIITAEWVKGVVSALQNYPSYLNLDSDAINKRKKWQDEHFKVEVYEVKGIHSLNVVVQNILDGGVNCSRRIDRHGKTISDLILCQQVVLPP
ncbi:hypothetical protein F8388_006693 [Cannabis sativa]|uniref:Uncharacterized protein n=1 Tax=Cannabis sativa TaxID=3483 RepID=A0A7J6GVE4_CANSA|nr:hypothetical protein F8388_006693 [Cannabis sativa]KAF4392844.1 hypothetical protein G4B88_011839 [Cannabis sativa]